MLSAGYGGECLPREIRCNDAIPTNSLRVRGALRLARPERLHGVGGLTKRAAVDQRHVEERNLESV